MYKIIKAYDIFLAKIISKVELKKNKFQFQTCKSSKIICLEYRNFHIVHEQLCEIVYKIVGIFSNHIISYCSFSHYQNSPHLVHLSPKKIYHKRDELNEAKSQLSIMHQQPRSCSWALEIYDNNIRKIFSSILFKKKKKKFKIHKN